MTSCVTHTHTAPLPAWRILSPAAKSRSVTMVKLYYTPTSCGAASFIVAHALKLNVECEQVNLGDHKTASGQDFYAINPKGNVPALVLDDGTVLNEGAAVLQYLGDQVCRRKGLLL